MPTLAAMTVCTSGNGFLNESEPQSNTVSNVLYVSRLWIRLNSNRCSNATEISCLPTPGRP